MASESILKIVQEMAGRVGLNKPGTATGSTDPQIIQLVSLANEEVQELAGRFDWQTLIVEQSFSTVNAEDQGLLVGAVCSVTKPPRKIINETMFNRTTHFPVTGPLTPTGWQGLKAVTTVAGFYSRYRIRSGHLLFYPAPAAAQSVYFEYITEFAVSSADGSAFRLAFMADDDFPLLDSRLIKLGLKWRWKSAKGLDYEEDFNTYERAVLDTMTSDGTKQPARLDGHSTTGVHPGIWVPRSNWMQ